VSDLTQIKITLKGYDDHTTITTRVSPAFAVALYEIALRTQETSEHPCMPTMHVVETQEGLPVCQDRLEKA
jgi:hypothetical protein